MYGSGLPLGVTRNNPLPIFNGADHSSITTYDGWLMPVDGRFDPGKNLYLNIAAFPTQLPYVIGNETRYNPKARGFWEQMNENISLSKTFPVKGTLQAGFPRGGIQPAEPDHFWQSEREPEQQCLRTELPASQLAAPDANGVEAVLVAFSHPVCVKTPLGVGQGGREIAVNLPPSIATFRHLGVESSVHKGACLKLQE